MLNEKQALRIIMRKMCLLTKASRFMLCSSVVLELVQFLDGQIC